jgi:ribonuclease E
MQIELRPGEPGYSGPAEEFGEDTEFVAAEEIPEGDVVEPTEEVQPETQPHAAERPASAPTAKETPPAPAAVPPANTGEPEAETERTPVAYNVSPPLEVTGPAPNPRRGWWRRG